MLLIDGMKKKPATIDEYIASYSEDVAMKLQQVREIIISVVPDAVEIISYGMPAIKTEKVLVYFAAFKSHIGFYPTASGIKAFSVKLEKYKWSKGAIQFPLNQKLPSKLIRDITRFRREEVKQKAKITRIK